MVGLRGSALILVLFSCIAAFALPALATEPPPCEFDDVAFDFELHGTENDPAYSCRATSSSFTAPDAYPADGGHRQPRCSFDELIVGKAAKWIAWIVAFYLEGLDDERRNDAAQPVE